MASGKCSTSLAVKGLTLHCRPVFSNQLGTDPISRFMQSHSKNLALETALCTAVFSSPRPPPAAEMSLLPRQMCSMPFFGLFTYPASTTAWYYHVQRDSNIGKELNAVAAACSNTAAENCSTSWPEGSSAGQGASSLSTARCYQPASHQVPPSHICVHNRTNISWELHGLVGLPNESSFPRHGCHCRMDVSRCVTA